MRSNYLSKFMYVILSVSLVLVSIAFLLPGNTGIAASASTMKVVTTPPMRLRNNSAVTYAKLNKPSAIAPGSAVTLIGDHVTANSEAGGLSNATSSGLINVLKSGNSLAAQIPTSAAPSDLFYHDIGIFSLEGSSLVVYAVSDASGSEYAPIKTFSAVTSFDIWNNYLYVATATGINIYAMTIDFDPVSSLAFTQEITSISRGYFASDKAIYQMTGELPELAATVVMSQNWSINKLIIDNNTAYYTTMRGLVKYILTDKTKIDYSSEDYSFGDIAVSSGKIYFTNDFDNKISAIDTESLTSITVIYASNHDADGFYNLPLASVTLKDAIYTVDSGNNRIVINKNNVFTYITNSSFNGLLGIAVSTKNEIYVLDSSAVYTYSQNLVQLSKKSLTAKNIDKIVSTSTGEVYVSSPTHVYKLSDMSISAQSVGAPISAIGASFNADIVLYAAGKSIYSTSSTTAIATSDTAIRDFVIDNDRQLYVLDVAGNITKFSNKNSVSTLASLSEIYEPTITLASPQPHFSQISLSRINNNTLAYGDILVTSRVYHSLYKFSSADFEVATFDESKFQHPIDVTESKADTIALSSQVTKLLTEVQLFEFPIEARSLITLPANTNVIVLIDSVVGFENFSGVLYHDNVSKNAIYGYVYRQTLAYSAYSAPPATTCKIFNDKTKIFRYPSTFSPLISENFSAAKNTSYEMLPFADYTDSSGNIWYRVKISDSTQGYVTKSNVSIRDYEPNLVRPQSNAKIAASEAFLYSLTEGKYTLLADEQPLIKGTEIEVVGMLDPSKEFTLIRYFDSKLGTLECYVLTSTIEYYNINSAQIIAVILLSITLIFGLVLVMRKVFAKRA